MGRKKKLDAMNKQVVVRMTDTLFHDLYCASVFTRTNPSEVIRQVLEGHLQSFMQDQRELLRQQLLAHQRMTGLAEQILAAMSASNDVADVGRLEEMLSLLPGPLVGQMSELPELPQLPGDMGMPDMGGGQFEQPGRKRRRRR